MVRLMKFIHRLKNDKALRFRLEKWFWVAMILPTVLWWHDSVLWVGLLSVYALVLTASSREEAAEAARAAKKK
jgi:hypothetical protein